MTADAPDVRPLKRSAEHWFLDAAVYARDGDRAIEAALAGIAALHEGEAQDA